jgi:hypothetical protein
MSFSQILSNHRYLLIGVLLISLVFIARCASPAAPLTVESLQNAEYQGIYPEPIQLTDGQYEGEPFEEGGASRPMVIFVEPYTFGGLDADGVDDAAVLLVENSGGSGSFFHLAAVLNRDGEPLNQATTLLGDRVQVEELVIDSGEIQVRMLTHGPDDPLCCPSQEALKNFTLKSGELVE